MALFANSVLILMLCWPIRFVNYVKMLWLGVNDVLPTLSAVTAWLATISMLRHVLPADWPWRDARCVRMAVTVRSAVCSTSCSPTPPAPCAPPSTLAARSVPTALSAALSARWASSYPMAVAWPAVTLLPRAV